MTWPRQNFHHHSTQVKPNQLNPFSSQEGRLAPAQFSLRFKLVGSCKLGGQAALPDLKIGWVELVSLKLNGDGSWQGKPPFLTANFLAPSCQLWLLLLLSHSNRRHSPS
jgi:hypothetical protein